MEVQLAFILTYILSIFEVNILIRFRTITDNINKYSKNILRNSTDFKTNNNISDCFSNILNKFSQHQATISDKFSYIIASKQTENMDSISLVIIKHLDSINEKLSVKEGNIKSSKGQVEVMIIIYPNKKKEEATISDNPNRIACKPMSDKRTAAATLMETLRQMPPNQGITKSEITLITSPKPMLMRSTVTIVLVIMEVLQPKPDMHKTKLPVIVRNGNITAIM